MADVYASVFTVSLYIVNVLRTAKDLNTHPCGNSRFVQATADDALKTAACRTFEFSPDLTNKQVSEVLLALSEFFAKIPDSEPQQVDMGKGPYRPWNTFRVVHEVQNGNSRTITLCAVGATYENTLLADQRLAEWIAKDPHGMFVPPPNLGEALVEVIECEGPVLMSVDYVARLGNGAFEPLNVNPDGSLVKADRAPILLKEKTSRFVYA
jgi:hypothetical protein